MQCNDVGCWLGEAHQISEILSYHVHTIQLENGIPRCCHCRLLEMISGMTGQVNRTDEVSTSGRSGTNLQHNSADKLSSARLYANVQSNGSLQRRQKSQQKTRRNPPPNNRRRQLSNNARTVEDLASVSVQLI